MKLFFHKIWPQMIIVILWLMFSFPYLVKGLIPFPSDYLVTFFPPWSVQFGMPVKNNAMPDVITQIYPWKKFTIETWKSGAVPLWNPYSFSGTPHAGNYQSAIFSPFNLIFFIFPFIDAWSVLILLQPLLAGLFMYLFVRSLERSEVASVIASVAFMFCGFMVVWMAYGTLGYAALFLPLIFWGVHKKSGTAVSLGIALSLLSGHFQTSVYVIGAGLAYIAWKKQIKPLWFAFLGILIAAPQVLLGFHSFASSIRGLTVLKGDVIPWQYLVTLIAPDFFGNPVTRNDWFGHYAEWNGFIGVIPLMLATYASARKKASETWFFIALTLVSLALALPTPVNDLLYVLKVPVLSGSAAARIIILVSFSLAVLSAFGFDSLVDDWKKKNIKVTLLAAAVWTSVVGAIWTVLLTGNTMTPERTAIAKHNVIVPGFLVLASGLMIILGHMKYRWVRYGIIALFIVAASFDLLRFSVKWMPFEPRGLMYPETKSLKFLMAHAEVDRVFGNVGAGEVGTRFRIPLIEGYDAVYQARYGEFVSAVSQGYITPGARSVVQFDKNGLYKTEALQLLGIRYIYHSLSDGKNVWVFPHWEYMNDGSMHKVYSDEQYEVFEYNNVYPRAFLASSYQTAGSDKEVIDTLFAGDFDRRNTLVLEEKPGIDPQPGSGSATIVSYTPDAVKIETDSSVPKLLFLSDVYDAGWQAAIDGRLSRILRADYDFRAVAVPAGLHIVEFRYQPAEFRWGIILTIVGIAGLAFLTKNK